MRIVSFVALALVFGLGACKPAGKGAAARGEPVLKIGSQKGSTRALLEASGVLAGAPYRVEWSEFGAASPLLEALADGAVDVGGVGDAPFMFAYAAGAPVRVILAYRSGTATASAVAVIAPAGSPIRTPADLRGRKVATVKGSVGHYLLIRLLQKNGIDPKSVQAVHLDPGSSRGALSSGAVDAWSTWSPYVGYGLLHDHDRKIADGVGIMSGIGFYAANLGSIQAKRPLLQDFVGRMARAYAWGRTHQDDYARRVSAETGLPLDVAKDMAQRLTATPTVMDDAVLREEADTLNAYKSAGVISVAPDLQGAFARQFNAAVQAPAP
jgi:sulfonate transport system substrate-binding protein